MHAVKIQSVDLGLNLGRMLSISEISLALFLMGIIPAQIEDSQEITPTLLQQHLFLQVCLL